MKYKINKKYYEGEIKYNPLYIKSKDEKFKNKTTKDRYIKLKIKPKTDIEVKLADKNICWINLSEREYLGKKKKVILYKGIVEELIIQVRDEVDMKNYFFIKENNKKISNQLQNIKMDVEFLKKRNIMQNEELPNNYLDDFIDKGQNESIFYIGDEYTLLSIKDIYNIYSIERNEIPKILHYIKSNIKERKLPKFLLIESFWEGKNNSWTVKEREDNIIYIKFFAKELKKYNIKIVFYNKEDPYHYNAFKWLAEISDLIITIDKDSEKRYKREFPHIPVMFNSFIINEAIFKYQEAKNLNDGKKIYFAGNYYNNRFEERKEFLNNIFDYMKIKRINYEIIDRFYNVENTTYGFPKRFQEKIKTGNLSNQELIEYIKEYNVGINVNSVNNDSFVSRRLIEHIALGKVMISNYSKAIEKLGISTVIYSKNNDMDEIFKNLDSLIYTEEELKRNSEKIIKAYGSLTFKEKLNKKLEDINDI